MPFQTRKTLVHHQNTNWDIFDEIQELSDPPYSETQMTGSRPWKVKTSLRWSMWHQWFNCSFMKMRELFPYFIDVFYVRTISTMSFPSFWALYVSIVLLSVEGRKDLGFHQKYLSLCSKDEQRFYRFGTTWGWVINDRIFILGWTVPLSWYSQKILSERQSVLTFKG